MGNTINRLFKNIAIGYFFKYNGGIYIKTNFSEDTNLNKVYNCVNLKDGFHEWIAPWETVGIAL